MNKTWLTIVGILSVMVIIAGCGPLDSASQSEVVQPVAKATRPTAIETEANPAQAEIAEIAGEALPTAETTTVSEVDESKGDEAVLPNQAVAQIEIPRPENKLAEGEYHWSQLLARDAIFPVYDPEFAPAEQAPYDDNELVIGVAINGEAKAYAIGPLNSREMVNDTLGGIPILVTW